MVSFQLKKPMSFFFNYDKRKMETESCCTTEELILMWEKSNAAYLFNDSNYL